MSIRGIGISGIGPMPLVLYGALYPVARGESGIDCWVTDQIWVPTWIGSPTEDTGGLDCWVTDQIFPDYFTGA